MDPREFARKLITACLGNVDDMWDQIKSFRDRSLVQGMRTSEVTLKILGVDLVQWVYRANQLETPELLDHALELPERMAVHLRRPLVLVFDEFQELAGIEGSALFKRMRSHWQRQPHTAYVFLGSQGGLIRNLFGQSRNPLYRFADILPLPPILPEIWMQYATQKFTQAECAIASHVMEDVLNRTGGHPFDTMKVLQHLAWEADETATRTITHDLAWIAFDKAAAELARHFETEIAGLRLPHARRMLLRLARGEGLYVPGVSPTQNKLTADTLVADGVLQKLGRGHYEFEEPMLKNFLTGHR